MDTQRIRASSAWLFHLARIFVVIWGAWHLWHLSLLWWDGPAMLQPMSKAFDLDLTTVPPGRFLAATVLSSALHVLLFYFCWCLWRMFTMFLSGRLFTVDTARQMRWTGAIGFVLTLVSIVYRPLFYAVLDERLLAKVPWAAYARPDDVLYLALALMVMALAAIIEIAAPPMHATSIAADSPSQASTAIGEVRG